MFVLLDAYSVAALTVSTRWWMRICGLIDTHCAAARYVSGGNAHRIQQRRSPYLSARRYGERSKGIRIWREEDVEETKEETMKGGK